jgi:hypothetical protein
VRPIYQNLGGAIPTGAKSAAQLIWDVAQMYTINPQALIVLLQKEQGIVTDDWAWAVQYEKATGYMCPDTAPCNATKAGFYNQIENAAWQFRADIDNIASLDDWGYYGLGWNNIRYSPNAACGTKPVYVENASTAALYKYTPYTPNAAALANLYGTGDACSAYGNRNFWRLFNDWFGATTTTSYNYQFVSSSYSTIRLDYGQSTTGNITIKNIGAATWYADGAIPAGQHPTRLSLLRYENTVFADKSDPNWLGTSNQIKMTPATVATGENATFTFKLKAPFASINPAALTFVPVVDGVDFMPNIGMQFIASSNLPKYSYVSAIFPPRQIPPNQKITCELVIKNVGYGAWYADGNIPAGQHPIRLGSYHYISNPFADEEGANWLGANNQIKMTPAIVNPGENATFIIELAGTPTKTYFNYRFLPVLDGVSWLRDYGMAFELRTLDPSYVAYQFASAVGAPRIMSPGQIANVSLSLKNTGNTTWKNESTRTLSQPALRLVMSQPWYRNSAFYNSELDSGWITPSQVEMATSSVGPGETGVFEFTFKAPAQLGTYVEYFAPVVDGVSLLHDINMGFLVTVQ